MDCSIEIRMQRVMRSVGKGHGFLTESQGFRIGRDLCVDTFNALILQMRKQRPRKTECPCSLEQRGLHLGSPDSQQNAFSLYPSIAHACWHRHSRNKSYFFSVSILDTVAPWVIHNMRHPQQSTPVFFFSYAHLLYRNIFIYALTEMRKSFLFSLQRNKWSSYFLARHSEEHRSASYCASWITPGHPDTSGLIWSLDCETKMLHIPVQFRRMTALFCGLSQSLRKACHHPADH